MADISKSERHKDMPIIYYHVLVSGRIYHKKRNNWNINMIVVVNGIK